jgi:hypothetical protein
MTVKELIKRLSKIENQDKEVRFCLHGYPLSSEIMRVVNNEKDNVDVPVFLRGN